MAEEFTPAQEALLQQRLKEVQLRLVVQQVARLPLPVLLIDGFLFSLLVEIDLAWIGLPWFILSAVLQLKRWRLAAQIAESETKNVDEALERLDVLFVVLGTLRALLILPLFARPIGPEHYLFTMVYCGLGAGAAFAVGGIVRTYVTWALIVGGTTAMAWIVQGTYEQVSAGVLMLTLFGLLVGFVRDQGVNLEQRERLTESLRIERDRTQAASDSKTRFFAAASHDLRQPLHALSINATTLELLAGRQTDPMMKELSESISRALRQSNGLLDSLLDISMLEANVVKIYPEPVQAVALMQAMCEEFGPTARHRGLVLHVDPEVASRDADVWILTDPKQIRRVLGNLISNGLKFTQAGSVTLSLRHLAGAEHDERTMLLSVTDTGPGIPSSEHERVFEEFYQTGNASRDRSKGLGLGLSIVRRTAVLLGMGISLHSALGVGTRFDLMVSVCSPPEGATDPTLGAAGESALGPTPQPNARVLAIDDEVDILDSLASMLPHFGCEIRCATNLIDAVEVLDSGFEPEILLVDHRLKGESGPEVIQILRRRLGDVPAIIVTGDTAPLDMQSAVAAGLRVIHKPLDGRVLARALADSLINPVS